MSTYAKRRAAKTATILAIAIAAICSTATIHAQDSAQEGTDERLLACADISDAAERIACFDEVVQGLNRGVDSSAVADAESSAVADAESPAVADAESPAVPDAESTAPPPAPAESPSAASAPIAAGAVATSIPSVSAGATATESPNASPPAASGDVISAAASANAAAEDFGLEDQKARADKKEKKQKVQESEAASFHGTIVRSAKSGENHFVVELDNGQVWEETDGSRRNALPRVGMSVEVSRGLFGSYRMKIGEDNRVARVRRLR